MSLGRVSKYTKMLVLFLPKIHTINSNPLLEHSKSRPQSTYMSERKKPVILLQEEYSCFRPEEQQKKIVSQKQPKKLLSEFNLKILVQVPSLRMSITVLCKSHARKPCTLYVQASSLHIKNILNSLKELPNRCRVLPAKHWQLR